MELCERRFNRRKIVFYLLSGKCFYFNKMYKKKYITLETEEKKENEKLLHIFFCLFEDVSYCSLKLVLTQFGCMLVTRYSV